MLEGRLVRLRPADAADIPLLTRLRNDVEVQAQLLSRPRGASPEQVAEWVAQRMRGPDTLFLVIAEKMEDQALGFIQYSGLSVIDRTAELGICLAPDAQGKGLAGDAMAAAEAWLVRQWAIRKVHLKVRGDNARAVACYRKAGFEPVGRYRDHVFFDGDWRDVLVMEKFLSGASR